MQYEIKQLGLGGILDQAVNLLKNHFGLFFGITLAIYVPWMLFQNFVTLAVMPELPAQPTMDDIMAYNQAALDNIKYTIPMTLFLAFVVVPITNAAIIDAVARCYLGKPTTVGGSLSRAVTIILPLLWTWLLMMLAIMGGMILCIIPGILFAFWFSLASHTVVIEGNSGVAALSRSKFLMTGNIGTVFVLSILVGVIQVAIQFGAGLIPQQHLAVIAAVALGAVGTIFGAAAFVVFYFSCRCKAENFDLQLLAEAVGAEPPQLQGDAAEA
jgi:hypothetical protein